MKFDFLSVSPGGSHPPGAVDGLVGGSGEHQQLVPLVRQQLGRQVDRQLTEEGQPPGPLHQLVHDGVADLAKLLLQVGLLLVEQLGDVLRRQKTKLLVDQNESSFKTRRIKVGYSLIYVVQTTMMKSRKLVRK